MTQMIDYSKRNLKYAEQYMTALPQGSAARIFCEIPLGLAIATVNIIEMGGKKLSREQVM